jgi:hypothetical protein
MTTWKSLHSHLNFALVCLLALLYLFSNQLHIPVTGIFVGRMHPLLLHLPIGMTAAVLLLHFSSYYDEKTRIRRMDSVLQWTLSSALLSALAGIILAAETDIYEQSEIGLHKHTGTAFALLFYVFTATYSYSATWVRHALLACNVGLLILAGHFGAEITHGNGFLFPKNTTKETDISVSSEYETTIYTAAILPLLEEKCNSCHNAEKTKGNLNMSDTLQFLKGGKNGPVLVWGKPKESLLLQRIHLDMANDEHMPPKERKQLTEQELALLNAWIQEARSFNQTPATLSQEGKLYSLMKPYFEKATTHQKIYTFEPLSNGDIQALNTPYRTVRPTFEGSPALVASFFLSSEYTAPRLQELKKASTQLTELSLAGMPVTDQDLAFIATFPNLEKLNLSGSNISSEGIETLSTLKKLERLSIAATGVDKRLALFWKRMPALKTVFIGQTRVPESELDLWRKQFPAIQFESSMSIPGKIQLSAPVLKNEETIINKGEKIRLHHFIKGVKIVYTTDGSMPDTLRGMEYNGPFAVSGSSDIRAAAVKDGWLASDVASFSVFEKGSPPPRCTLLTEASSQYAGKQEKTFTDGAKAPASNLRDENWIAYRDQPFKAMFSYEQPQQIRKISFSYALQIPQYVFPPTSIRIMAGNDIKQLKQVAYQKLPVFAPATKEQIATQVIHLPLPGGAYKYFRIEAPNLPVIPSWHPGKGEKGWLFIDEIFFYE